MLIYFINGILAGITAFFFNKKKKIIMIWAWLQTFFLMGMRDVTVGQDTLKYYWKFEQLHYYTWEDLIHIPEFYKFPGWWIVNKAIIDITHCSSNFYMVSSGLAIASLLLYIISKQKSNYGVTYFLFYFLLFLQCFNITRETIAVLLVYIAYINYKEGKKITSCIIMLCAISIHVLSLFGIVIFIFEHVNWTRKKYMVVFILTVVSPLIVEKVMVLFTSVFLTYGSYSLGLETARGLNAFVYLIEILICFYCYRVIRHEDIGKEAKKELNVIIAVSLLTATMGIIYAREILMTRIILIFHFAVFLYVPKIMVYKNRYRKIIIMVIFAISIVNYVYRFIGNYGNIIPYSTFFREA